MKVAAFVVQRSYWSVFYENRRLFVLYHFLPEKHQLFPTADIFFTLRYYSSRTILLVCQLWTCLHGRFFADVCTLARSGTKSGTFVRVLFSNIKPYFEKWLMSVLHLHKGNSLNTD